MAGIYYKVSLRNQQANQEDNPIAILEDKKYSSSKSDSKDFSKTLDTIKEQATTITDNLDSYDWLVQRELFYDICAELRLLSSQTEIWTLKANA